MTLLTYAEIKERAPELLKVRSLDEMFIASNPPERLVALGQLCGSFEPPPVVHRFTNLKP